MHLPSIMEPEQIFFLNKKMSPAPSPLFSFFPSRRVYLEPVQTGWAVTVKPSFAGHSCSNSSQSNAGQPCTTNHTQLQGHFCRDEGWKVQLGPAGSIQHIAPIPPGPPPVWAACLSSPLSPQPCSLAGLWSTCELQTAVAIKRELPQPAVDPHWQCLKDNHCHHLKRQIKMTS